MLDKAIRIASVAFEDIKDKGGKPYILHCLWVMDRVRHLGYKYMIVAVLHDLLEDTRWTTIDLIQEGFDPELVEAIDVLTKRPKQIYTDYIKLVKSNKFAREVKLRDLEHNSKITRLKGISKKDTQRMVKYNKAYLTLKN